MDINNEKVKAIIEWLTEKKADAISVYDLTHLQTYTNYIVVCEGQADLHVRAIGQYLIDMCKAAHLYVLSKEGLDYAHWVLIDLGDVIIHVFMPETRAYYKIDEFIKSNINKTETTEN